MKNSKSVENPENLCLDGEEAYLINQVILNEEFLLKEDSIKELRLRNLEARLLAYDVILQIDKLNQQDREDQVRLIRSTYDSCKADKIWLQNALKAAETREEKQINLKKTWRTVTFVASPVCLVGGMYLMYKIQTK